MKEYPDNFDLKDFDSYGNMPESPESFVETYDPRSEPPTAFTWVLSAVMATILGALWIFPMGMSINPFLIFGGPLFFLAVFVGVPVWALFRVGKRWPKTNIYAVGWLVSPAVTIAIYLLSMRFA